MEKYYNLEEASQQIKCSTQTLRRAIQSKKLKASMIGHSFIVAESDLINYIKSKQVN